MGITSLQVCMDSSNWLQGTIHEEAEMDSSSSPSGEILTCSRPLMETRLRPQHDKPLNCPRCDSTHTKFCYYNNYSLSQPRYFCKTCRRYWTKGGTLRNIPIGGGCRKSKKVSSKKSDFDPHFKSSSSSISILPEMPFPYLSNPVGNPSFMLENAITPFDFIENRHGDLVESSRHQNFIGNGEYMGMINGYGETNTPVGLCTTFGMSIDGDNFGTIMDASQRLMLPYHEDHVGQNSIDVKPNPKFLSLEWHDQGCPNNAGKESFGYLNGGLGSWTGLMSGYGSSATNPLV